MTYWKFKPFTEDDTKENPTQSQFFTTEGLGNIATGLIREGIQNSLDERLDSSKPVRVIITMSKNDLALKSSQYLSYLKDLQPHLNSKDVGLRDLPNFETDDLDYIIYEDFNTKGLRGEPSESKDVDVQNQTRPHNFYYFWRNVGITGKSENKLGKWGVGKTVFPASSRISTFWGLTIQCDTQKELLLGQCIIKKHNIENAPLDWGYKPYGYYGKYDREGSFFPHPIEDPSTINIFKSTFKIRRKDEPGLSILIPFPKSDITSDALIFSTLSQYFYPILKGDLVVHLIEGDREVVLDAKNMRTLTEDMKSSVLKNNNSFTFDANQFSTLIDFTEWLIRLPEDNYYTLSTPDPEKTPRWNFGQLLKELDKNILIEHFEQSKRIAFKIPIKYCSLFSSEKTAKTCWFKLFMERDESLKFPEDHFIRNHITIVDVKSISIPGIRCIVLIEDIDLSNLLGDSENPAHTSWQRGSEHFANKYKHGDECLQFIAKSPQKIFDLLQRPSSGIVRDVLKDIFYVEIDSNDNEPIHPDDDSIKDDLAGKEKMPEFEKSISHRVLSKKIDGGLRVYGKNLTKENLPNVVIKVAYMTTRGKPLNKYQTYDFEVDKVPININELGCSIISKQKNEIVIEVNDPDFCVSIVGFDPKRDLFIDVKPQYPDSYDPEI